MLEENADEPGHVDSIFDQLDGDAQKPDRHRLRGLGLSTDLSAGFLDPREVIFVAAFISSFDQLAAAAEAGITRPHSDRLMEQPRIRDAIFAMGALRVEALLASPDWTVATLKRTIEKAIEKGHSNAAVNALKLMGERNGLWGRRVAGPGKVSNVQNNIISFSMSQKEGDALMESHGADVVGLSKLNSSAKALLPGSDESETV